MQDFLDNTSVLCSLVGVMVKEDLCLSYRTGTDASLRFLLGFFPICCKSGISGKCPGI